MQTNKSFSLIELIFVLIIIIVLSSVFLNKFLLSDISNKIIDCKNDLNIINHAFAKYKNNLLLKKQNSVFDINTYINNNWTKKDNNEYVFNINKSLGIVFTYDSINNTFNCNKDNDLCKKVLN